MEVDLGEEEVTSLELVEHDWYNSFHKKRIIGRVKLGEINQLMIVSTCFAHFHLRGWGYLPDLFCF